MGGGLWCPLTSAMKPQQQEATLGKNFWHQFTTVVVLKQNMRQMTQSEEDTKLRTALENMRYAACTKDDILFLNTLVAKNLQRNVVTDPEFRNVSVITAWNNQKDEFNEQGSARFEADNKQRLTDFYSIDSLGPQYENGPKKKRDKHVNDRHVICLPNFKKLYGIVLHVAVKISLRSYHYVSECR